MYADRHARSSAIDPRSLGIAVALNGAVVAALVLAQPVFKIVSRPHTLTTYAVPIEPPPEPLLPEAPRQPVRQTQSAPQRLVETPVAPTMPTAPTSDDLPLAPVAPTVEVGPTVFPSATPTPALVTVAPEIDPAHRGDLQPAYPADELRAEREGSVVVRVLVGTDGRVRQVESVSATSDAFFRATRERALARWRFRPATRGGVPVEAWQRLTIRFVIPR